MGKRDDGDGRVPYLDRKGRLTIYKFPGDSWQVANKRDAAYLEETESFLARGRAGFDKRTLVRRFVPAEKDTRG